MHNIDSIRAHFPAFDGAEPRFFENAGGSFPCRQTVEALTAFYTETKVQPYGTYDLSHRAGLAMDRSHERWAQALGVANREIVFGPSTSMNTYVLAHAFADVLGPGDEVIVTNQDHEANTGATRRMVDAVGATLREWRVDPATGLLDIADLEQLLSESTALVVFPHCSNIVGTENDVAAICGLAAAAGAATIVDGVSYAPHGFCDVDALGADVYLFSMYKTYSVHQGLMVVRDRLADRLPNQSHWFNAGSARKRFVPAGPDHAQVAAASAVLDYVESSTGIYDNLRAACAEATMQWQAHEAALLAPVMTYLSERPDIRVIGQAHGVDLDTIRGVPGDGLHRCPTVAFVSEHVPSARIGAGLAARGIMAGAGSFYADRLLDAVGIDPADGVVRLSWVHYTSQSDIDALMKALDEVLDSTPSN